MKNLYHIFLIIAICLSLQDTINAQTIINLDNVTSDSCVSYQIIEATSSSYKVKFNIHHMYDSIISHGGINYHSLRFDNDDISENIGWHELPVIRQLIAIPQNATFNISISEGVWKNQMIGSIFPHQRPLFETETDTTFYKSDSIYSLNVYQPSIYTQSEISVWRNVRNFTLSLCPFKCWKGGRVAVLREFTLNIQFTPVGNNQIISPFEQIQQVDMTMFNNHYGTTNNSPQYNISLSHIPNYLIIVGNNSEIVNSDALKRFVFHKTLKGFKCKVVTTNETGHTPDSIKEYIKTIYNQPLQEFGIKKPELEYVFLIGDDNTIPSKRVPSPVNQSSIISDYWYGCMDDDDDYMADVYIGRCPTNDLNAFSDFASKILSYEHTLSFSDKDVLIIASKDSKNFIDNVKEIVNSNYATPTNFYSIYGNLDGTNGSINAINSLIVEKINSGFNIIDYRGHGALNYWSTWNYLNENFGISQLQQLVYNTFPVFFSIACHTGNYTISNNFLNKYLLSKNGASSFLGASRESYRKPNSSYNKLLFLNLKTNNLYNLAKLNTISHLNNNIKDPFALHNAYAYICGGDPSLEIWTSSPASFTSVSVSRNGNSFLFTSDNLCSSTIVVTNEDLENIQKINCTASSITLNNLPNKCYVTFNKHNYYPHTIFINTEEAFIQNKEIYFNNYYYHDTIQIGQYVTQDYPQGEVAIKNGGSINIIGAAETTIKDSFICEKGATLTINP